MKKVFLFFGLLAAVCSQALAQDTLTMDAPPSNYLYMVWSDQDSLRHSALGFEDVEVETDGMEIAAENDMFTLYKVEEGAA